MNLHALRHQLLRLACLPFHHPPVFSTRIRSRIIFSPSLKNFRDPDSHPKSADFGLRFAPCAPSFESYWASTYKASCPPSRIRTYDRSLKRRLLYQLSYGRVCLILPTYFVQLSCSLHTCQNSSGRGVVCMDLFKKE